MLRWSYFRRCAGCRIRGVAPHASRGLTATKDVISSSKQQGVCAVGDGSEREIIRALRDASARVVDGRVSDSYAKLDRIGAAIGSFVADVLPQPLIDIVDSDAQREHIAGVWLNGQHTAKDRAGVAARESWIRRAICRRQRCTRLVGQAGPGDTV